MMRWFKNLSITIRVTLLLSLAAVTFLLLLAFGTYQTARRELEHSIKTSQTAMVSSLAGQIDVKLEASRNYLKHLSTHILQNPEHSKAISLQQMLNQHDESRLFFDAGILQLSPDGKIVAEIPFHPERIGQDRSAREYFRLAVKDRKMAVSSPYQISLPPHQPVVAFSLPVMDKNGRLVSVLVGRHSLRNWSFLDKLIDAPIGKTGYFYLFNRERMLLIHHDKNRVLTTVRAGGNQAIEDALKGWSGTRENVNSKGSRGLTSVYPLKNAPWYIASHFPVKEAYAPLERARKTFIVVLLLTASAAVFVVWLTMRPLAKSLGKITTHMKELNSKNGEARFLPVTSSDETGHLSAKYSA